MAGEISFRPTEADYVAAQRDWLRRHLRTKRAWRGRLVGIGLVSCAFAVIGAVDGGPVSAATYAVLGLLFMPLLLLLSYGAALFWYPRRSLRFYRQQKNKNVEIRFAWSDEAITFTMPRSSGSFEWRDFYRWARGRSALLLLVNEALFYYVPLRLLGEEVEAEIAANLQRAGVKHF